MRPLTIGLSTLAILFLLSAQSALPAPIQHTITFSESVPGSGGPFYGVFAVEETLLQPNITIRFSQMQNLSFMLYGIAYSFTNFSDPDDRGFRTDGAGVLQPVVTDLAGNANVFFAQFVTSGSNFPGSEMFFRNMVWDWEQDGAGGDVCTNANLTCSGTYTIAIGDPPTIPEPPVLLLFLIGTVLACVRAQNQPSRAA